MITYTQFVYKIQNQFRKLDLGFHDFDTIATLNRKCRNALIAYYF